MTASYRELMECLMKIYCKIYPQGGIRYTSRRGTKQLAAGFYRVGCPHPAIECLIAQLNKLIMHYGSSSGLGLNMQTSPELLIIVPGLSLQPFTEDYDTCQHWWVTSSRLNIQIQLAPLPLQPTQEQDTWIRQSFSEWTTTCTPSTS